MVRYMVLLLLLLFCVCVCVCGCTLRVRDSFFLAREPSMKMTGIKLWLTGKLVSRNHMTRTSITVGKEIGHLLSYRGKRLDYKENILGSTTQIHHNVFLFFFLSF